MVTIRSRSQSAHGHNPVDGWYRCGMDITGSLAVWQHGRMVMGSFQAVTIVTPAAALSTYWSNLSFCSRIAGPYSFAVTAFARGGHCTCQLWLCYDPGCCGNGVWITVMDIFIKMCEGLYLVYSILGGQFVLYESALPMLFYSTLSAMQSDLIGTPFNYWIWKEFPAHLIAVALRGPDIILVNVLSIDAT